MFKVDVENENCLTSFEYVALQFNSSSWIIFLNSYRSPKYSAYFLMTLLNYYLLFALTFDCVFFVGDFNIHADKPEDRGT